MLKKGERERGKRREGKKDRGGRKVINTQKVLILHMEYIYL